MVRKTTLMLSTLFVSGASTLLPMAASAEPDQSQMPAPAVSAAAQPDSKVLLQGVIDELLQGKSEFAQMEPTLRVNLMQRPGLIPSLTARLQSLGELQSVTFAGKQNGSDIYDVRFAGAASTWAVALAPDGKIAGVSWRFR